MSNHLLTSVFGSSTALTNVVQDLELLEKLPSLRTFFSNYRNPIGIEVEVEGIEEEVPTMHFWSDKDDGSLRNHGREFVSKPLSGRYIDYALAELDAYLSETDHEWSHRCSIHVHQNMSTLREKHLMGYVMVYGLFEDLFYSMVEPYRAGNSFCYPATNVEPGEFLRITDSNKYCGLNLFPLKVYGTVEFRQMHGHNDFKLLRRWIQLIVKLHAWVEKQKSSEIVGIVTKHIQDQTYVALASEIWGVNATLFTHEQIHASARRAALWSLCLSKKEFN
jgi:hypothetical protein